MSVCVSGGLAAARVTAEFSKCCLTQNLLSLSVFQHQVSPHIIRSVFHASLRSRDPDEFNRELSSVFSFPVCASYTSAHLSPVPAPLGCL